METIIPRIESQDLALDRLFQDFYLVPDYQREFVWEEEHVERLLQDAFDEFYDDAGRIKEGPEYFVGSIVVSRNEEGVYELIDGQQRMTTVFLFYCAAQDMLSDAGETPQAWLIQRIRDSQMNPRTGDDVERYRLQLQYEDADGALEKIAARSQVPEEIQETTESVRRITGAYHTIRAFFRERFGDDLAKAKQFLAAFSSRVKLIRIETPSVANALKVFETINDRGIGLDSMDLLRNLVFRSATTEDFLKLKERWKKITDTIDACREKPLRFLRYYVLSQHSVEPGHSIREDEVYDWFRNNAERCGLPRRPLDFTDDLLGFALDYANMVKGNSTDGTPNPHLRSIFAINRQARQHLVLLLAARQAPPEVFDELCRTVEKLFFCYAITRVNTNVAERNFVQWADDLLSVRHLDDLHAFKELYVEPEMRARAREFAFAFGELTMDRFPKYRMRYILAKLTQYVERSAWGNPAHDVLEQYLDRSVDIEHILPRNPREDVAGAFDKPAELKEYVGRLGNLMLLEKSINTSVGNGSFADKAPGYNQSQYLLTKSIVSQPQVGKATQVDRAVEGLLQFDHWDSGTIEQRQHMLTRLARDVWGMPEAGSHAEESDG